MHNAETNNCEAFGCINLGIYSNSTNGNHRWYCWLHFRADFEDHQRISHEVNKNAWLSRLIKRLRAAYDKDHWPFVFKGAQTTLEANRRSDLQWVKGEPLWSWIDRLEIALRDLCEPPREERKASQLVMRGPFSRIQFEPVRKENETRQIGDGTSGASERGLSDTGQ